MELREHLAECVARGAAWLDLEYPGWESSIDLARLDLHSKCNCILGQRFGDFSIAPTTDLPKHWMGFDLSLFGAFASFGAPSIVLRKRYDLLRSMWTDLILSRRAQVELPQSSETPETVRQAVAI